MQYNVSEWTIYTPFEQCNIVYLFSSVKTEPNSVNKYFFFILVIAKYTHGHIYESAPRIVIEFIEIG